MENNCISDSFISPGSIRTQSRINQDQSGSSNNQGDKWPNQIKPNSTVRPFRPRAETWGGVPSSSNQTKCEGYNIYYNLTDNQGYFQQQTELNGRKNFFGTRKNSAEKINGEIALTKHSSLKLLNKGTISHNLY